MPTRARSEFVLEGLNIVAHSMHIWDTAGKLWVDGNDIKY